MSSLKLNVEIVECVILLVLLLALPLKSSALSGGSLDSGQSGPTDSSQQIFRRMDGELTLSHSLTHIRDQKKTTKKQTHKVITFVEHCHWPNRITISFVEFVVALFQSDLEVIKWSIRF